jgi:hypothetical protein
VVLRADTLRLLLPQADVGAASYLDQLPQAIPGVFRRGGAAGEQAVVALSSQMRPLRQYPKDRFWSRRWSRRRASSALAGARCRC